MKPIQWVDELPGEQPRRRAHGYQPREQSQDLHDHAAELIKHPLRWAKYPRKTTEYTAKVVYNNIDNGTNGAYRGDHGFEAARRGDQIYVRYNPDLVSPLKRGFDEGFREGQKSMVLKLRKGIWNLRKTLAEMENEYK